MPFDPRPARPNGRPAQPALPGLGALILLAGLVGCGGVEAPAEPAPPQVQARPEPQPTTQRPPSSFSLVVDEALRRKRVVERLKVILRESEP